MSRNALVRLLVLVLALSLAACAAYQAQHAAPAGSGGHRHAAPSDARITHIQGEVEAVKADLARQGRYACCVEPPCTQCLLKYGECHCREAIRKEGPCCGECTEAWIEGRGAVEGVTAWELLERKKQVLDEVHKKEGGGERPPGEHQHHQH
ncbi:MAG TPA: hypothetical protein VF789_06115 [Thermoanaerobaculia bacterium]